MRCKLYVFRHAETFDNSLEIFLGWRDSELTSKRLAQAQKIAEQLKMYQIDYAFTSRLKRVRKTLEVVPKVHPMFRFLLMTDLSNVAMACSKSKAREKLCMKILTGLLRFIEATN